MKPKYVIFEDHKGVRFEYPVKHGTTDRHQKGWLSYELQNGTTGLARPGTWQKVEDNAESK